MTKRTLLASAILVALPGLALAQSRSPQNCAGNGGSTYCNQPINQNIQQTWANGGAGGQGGQGGNATSGASASANVNVDNGSSNRSYAIGLPSYAAASGPCVGSSTMVGGGLLGGGLTVGRTELENECQLREAARLYGSLGDTQTAFAILRSLPSVQTALGIAKTTAGTPEAAPEPAPVRTVTAQPLEVAPTPIPAWCATASRADGPRVIQACGLGR